MLWLFALLVFRAAALEGDSCGDYNSLLFRSIGNVTITGMFSFSRWVFVLHILAIFRHLEWT